MDPKINPPEKPPGRFGQWLWRRPRRWFLLGIPAGGMLAFLVGIGFSGGFAEGIHYASSLNFCAHSCHEMETPFQEYTQSVHYKNMPGVSAVCADCHVPPQFIPGLIRHMKASVELVQHALGEMNTPAKYESHRAELAQAVWTELKANDSAECRSCHNFAAMDFSKQEPMAAKMHVAAAMPNSGKTCIDCHKGIAHKMPDVSSPDASKSVTQK
jgi:cytochrome c-type protein NapC